ncbi:MAG: hypothetical protein ACM3SY_04355 [Candidatus Omnitrophota bacterium]
MARNKFFWSRRPAYVGVAERKEKAEKSLVKLKKKNEDLKPVFIEDSVIAWSWWGQSWNMNLERYADFRNRISRGRSYVLEGSVLDLQIHSGQINALVQGTRSRPYSVTIQIERISPVAFQYIQRACAGKFESLKDLLAGRFPKALANLFTHPDNGLFPSPKEIRFSCKCPDSALMCKHVAAVLYGVSTRLDTDPGLLFALRQIEIKDLVGQVVKHRHLELLARAERQSARVIRDCDLSSLFDIQLDETVPR